jgi:hypothetical protein
LSAAEYMVVEVRILFCNYIVVAEVTKGGPDNWNHLS